MAGSLGAFRLGELLTRRRAPVLTYHRFNVDGSRFGGVTPGQFESHLRILRDRFAPVTFSRIVRATTEGEPIPPGAIAVTIDDGYADVHAVALPLLERYGVPATVFVVTDFVEGRLWLWPDRIEHALLQGANPPREVTCGATAFRVDAKEPADRKRQVAAVIEAAKRLPDADRRAFVDALEVLAGRRPGEPLSAWYAPMTWEQVRDCAARGVEIGSHTVSHPILATQPAASQRRELAESKRVLEERLQRPVDVLAYPNGGRADFTEETEALARECGYAGAASTMYGFAKPAPNPFAIRRMTARSDERGFRQVVSGWQRFGSH